MITIYALGSTDSNFVYIGCTECSLAKRFREHKSRANSGSHRCKLLIDDWRKYGAESFKMVPLEQLPDGSSVVQKREAELKWMKFFEGKLYNEHIVSFQPTKDAIKKGIEASRTSVGNRWTEEANMKRRLAQLGKPKNHGAKISETKKRLGQKPSAEAASKGGIAATKIRYGL